ncbi:Serine/threonine-protein kinase RIO2 [Gracilariopsis chorda]|uniref:Serine/threonine-protein kinase RIO2 n=1 Tax=Gracilariopsis chorda TaxID=448386 RepID=A0A2V3IP39_9FLOR|nr:Serine/threonine-protein kinase RIO2 [Gracilariopsis chorda]|eukprot:PXF43819.1 Serine/threonine-protein kinase RIO2 [Gracilariopsis chorda]
MKLDPAALRYLTDDDFRVLTAVEMGMRNHELVPIPLISAISGLKHGGYMKSLKQVHKHKLVHRESKPYVGYRLTSMGYDYLALNALVKRRVIDAVGRPLGVGKEADVFVVSASEQLMDDYPELADTPHLAMKLHRLGRTSFRAVKSKRDYLVHRKSASWIYFSRLAAMKEYAFMCALHARGFPVPRPLGQSRHIVVMELCPGALLTHVHEMPQPQEVANNLLQVIVRLAQHGLVHCDLNEFNIIVDDDGAVNVIDFPQMVSTRHADAHALFDRDVDGIRKFFEHRFGVAPDDMLKPSLADIVRETKQDDQLDVVVSASGFKNPHQEDGFYGAQDSDQEEEEDELAIDMNSLQIATDVDDRRDDAHAADRDVNSEEQSESEDVKHGGHHEHDTHASSQYTAPAINRALVEARVRKQRTNQARRRQLAKRNIVKDSQKRKLKAEVEFGDMY